MARASHVPWARLTAGRQGALDANGDLLVDGGTVLAAGSAGMVVVSSTDSAQSSLAISFDSTQPAGTVVQVVDSSGTVIASFESTKEFASVVFSSEDPKDGEEYQVYTGGTLTGTTVGGYAEGGSTDGATASTTTVAGDYSNVSSAMGPGAGHGQHG